MLTITEDQLILHADGMILAGVPAGEDPRHVVGRGQQQRRQRCRSLIRSPAATGTSEAPSRTSAATAPAVLLTAGYLPGGIAPVALTSFDGSRRHSCWREGPPEGPVRGRSDGARPGGLSWGMPCFG